MGKLQQKDRRKGEGIKLVKIHFFFCSIKSIQNTANQNYVDFVQLL